jgi:hypothetical protein
LEYPIHRQNSVYRIAGVLLVLFLTGCGQTNEAGGPQPGPTAAQAESTGPHQPAGLTSQERQFPYAPDEVLVKFNPEVEAGTIADIRAELKLETIQKFLSPNLFLMKISDGTSVEKMIKRLNAYGAVKYAEPNYGVKTTQ